MDDKNMYGTQAGDPRRNEGRPKKEKKPKRKRGRGKRKFILFLILLLIIAVAILVLLYGDKLGLGDGFGLLPGAESGQESGKNAEDENEPTAVPAEVSPTPAQPASVPDAFITVKEEQISLNGTALTLDDLRAQLEGPYAGAKVTLIDDLAIKEAYEGVEGLLDDLHITYSTQ